MKRLLLLETTCKANLSDNRFCLSFPLNKDGDNYRCGQYEKCAEYQGLKLGTAKTFTPLLEIEWAELEMDSGFAQISPMPDRGPYGDITPVTCDNIRICVDSVYQRECNKKHPTRLCLSFFEWLRIPESTRTAIWARVYQERQREKMTCPCCGGGQILNLLTRDLWDAIYQTKKRKGESLEIAGECPVCGETEIEKWEH